MITTNAHAEFLRPTLAQTQLMGCDDYDKDNKNATSFPGSLFTASLSRWNRDPGNEVDRNELREDSGLLTEKSHLLVIQLRFGDTGASSEDGNHTLGKLKPYGME